MRFTENPIWRKLEIFSIDPPDVSLTFEKRLARDNRWSLEFASSVVLEYKRFLFLCASQDQPCTPSDIVDQAWHLHLAYTKSYWNDLCENVLGKELHHNPTEGGQSEQEKFQDYYYNTWVLYKDTFLEDPPESIWPHPANRFAGEHFERVDKDQNWIIQKRKANWFFIISALSVVIGMITNNVAYPFFIILCTIFYLFPPKKSGHHSDGCGGGCGGDAGCSADGGCSGCGGGCGGD